MKLITECSTELELFEGKDKQPYIIGIFSSAEVKNNNGRRYKKELLEREVTKFVSEKVKNRSSFGELSHPSGPDINLDKVAIVIESLEWKGGDVYGKAKILDTPMGKIAKELVKEGRLGISSRGLGTVSESGYVNEDFNLITYDLVADASNPASQFVNGILEGKEFASTDTKEITEDEAHAEFLKFIKKMVG
jgi:hypothetical protein